MHELSSTDDAGKQRASSQSPQTGRSGEKYFGPEMPFFNARHVDCAFAGTFRSFRQWGLSNVGELEVVGRLSYRQRTHVKACVR